MSNLDRRPLHACYTIDEDTNEATLQALGYPEIVAAKIPRLQILMEVMNSGEMNDRLASLGLPMLGKRNRVVVICEEEIGISLFQQCVYNSIQTAKQVLELKRMGETLEVTTEQA